MISNKITTISLTCGTGNGKALKDTELKMISKWFMSMIQIHYIMDENIKFWESILVPMAPPPSFLRFAGGNFPESNFLFHPKMSKLNCKLIIKVIPHAHLQSEQ